MKVLMLIPGIEPNGITTHTLALVEGLHKSGHEIYILSGDVNTEYAKTKEFYNSFLSLAVSVEVIKKPKGNFLKKLIMSLRLYYRSFLFIHQINPEIIHAHSPHMSLIPKLTNKKFILTLHQTHVLKKNSKIRRPNRLIAISKESREFGKNLLTMSDEKIDLIHHGVSNRFSIPTDGNTLQEIKVRHGISDGKIILGLVGRIEKLKGHDIMVNALKGLNPLIKKKIHFIFLGGNQVDKSFKWLENLVEEAEIQSFVSIIPFEDPKPYYDIMDIFILPSRTEAFPLVVIEAMMSECCIVRSNVQGAYEQVEVGYNGYVFQNENDSELTYLIERLVNDTSLMEGMKANAKKKALKEFTIPIMTEKTIEVYNKLL